MVYIEKFVTLLFESPAFVIGMLTGMIATGYKNGRLSWEQWRNYIDDRLDHR